MIFQSSCKHCIAANFAFKQKRLLQLSVQPTLQVPSTKISGAGTGGAAAPLPFYQEGQGGQYCPFHFSMIVTKQTPANLKAGLPNAEEI